MNSATAGSGSAGAKWKQRRRAGRIVALQLAYAWDRKGGEDDGLLAGEGMPARGEAADFGRRLFAGLVKELPAVDVVIGDRLNNWTVPRLAVPDRGLLRLGCYELLYEVQTPTSVIINEYIELAKLYGTEAKTTKLVNAVLDRIAKDHRRDDAGS